MRTLRALCLLSIVALGAQLAPEIASAQESDGGPKQGEFSVQRFEPAPGPRNYLSVETARMAAAIGWSAGVMFDYARNPFVVRSCLGEEDCSEANTRSPQDIAVISDMFTWNLLGSITPVNFLQVGLRLPLVYVNGQGIDVTDGSAAEDGLTTLALGDPMLEGKVRFLGDPQDTFVLGAALGLTAPLGHATAQDKYVGSSAPLTVGLRIIADVSAGPVSFGANLGAKLLPEKAKLGTTEIGPLEYRYGGGVAYQVSPVFRVLAEAYGSSQFSASTGISTKQGANALEIDGAVQIMPLSSGLVITAGGGAGVIQGVGVPVARAIAGVAFVSEPGDEDRDGIDDRDDDCPTEPEDEDQFEDDDGCPEDDNDRDGVPDGKDKCPDKMEVINGLSDEDGCPDDVPDRDKDSIPDENDKCPDDAGKARTKEHYGCPDTDKDGVADLVDQCVGAPEDTDGFQDTDGCPDPDNDGDGIPDEGDECIDIPEVKNGFKDEDGCPDATPDGDNDGIPDDKDQCPTKPENLNGVEDDDGCPDRGASLVEVGESDIKILQRVEFATNSDKIQGAKSFAVLDAVVSAMKNHPEIFQVEVAGHTDNQGAADRNRTLSQKRAEAVVAYLREKGIEGPRLTPKGYGPDKPIAENNTNAGRQKNRRVEFNILKSAKKSQ